MASSSCLERGLPLGRLSEIRHRARLDVSMGHLGLTQHVLDRGSTGRGVCQCGVELRLAASQALRGGVDVPAPVVSGRFECRGRISQLLFECGTLPHRRVVLPLDLCETHGQRCLLGGMSLIGILASAFSGGQLAFKAAARGRLSIEPILESRMPLGGLSQIRGRPCLEPLIGGFGGRQFLFDGGTGRERLRQGSTQFSLAPGQLLCGPSDVRSPVAPCLIEVGGRVGQRAFDRRQLPGGSAVLSLKIGKASGQRGELGCMLLIRFLARGHRGGEHPSSVVRAAMASVRLVLDCRVSAGCPRQLRCETRLRVLVGGLGLSQSVLDRRTGREGLGQRCAQFCLTLCPLLCGRRNLRLPLAPRLLEVGGRVGQLSFDRRQLPGGRAGTLSLKIGKARGQRGQLSGVLLIRFLTRGHRGGEKILQGWCAPRWLQ